ncbi:hypothetical protein Q1695_002371 [Nippostrongylus brasiliensis]|nr:hypothetical protein Q1695_002371 [Nippostrongylus brasiliensis]
MHDYAVLGITREWHNSNGSFDVVDIFTVCPYEDTNPLNESLDDQQSSVNCTPSHSSLVITKLEDSRVYKLKNTSDYRCWARCIEYYTDTEYSMSEWKFFLRNTFACDFVETKCAKKNHTDRFMLHQQIVEQPVEKHLNPAKYPDVHVFILDSVSSRQAIRALPRTVNLFINEFNAVRFPKLNRVGKESRANAFPLFLGVSIEDAVKTIMGMPTIPADYNYRQHCDQYLDGINYTPMEYTKFGYMTVHIEDYHTTALYWPKCRGFYRKQTHHSNRPYYTRFRASFSHLERELCLPPHKQMLDYLSKFLNSYKGKPKFSLTWLIDFAHDDASQLYSKDHHLYTFFKEHHHLLNNSFIFFMSDHGLRFGKEAETPTGRHDVNNPFLYVVLPNRLKDSEIYKQVVENSKELVTHFDLHATFSDILYEQPSTNFTNTTFMRFDEKGRESSLLRKFEEGVVRNCKNLPIPSAYCLCQYGKKKVTDSRLSEELGESVAKFINGILKLHRISNSTCHRIEAEKKSILVQQYTLKDQSSSTVSQSNVYDVEFTAAAPARGRFKTVVKLDGHGQIMEYGQIPERIDKYGDDGACVPYYNIRPLCSCVEKK